MTSTRGISTRMLTDPLWLANTSAIIHDPLSRVVYRVQPPFKSPDDGSSEDEDAEDYTDEWNVALRRSPRGPACKRCERFATEVKEILGPRILAGKTRCGTYYPYTQVEVDLQNPRHIQAEVDLTDSEVELYNYYLKRVRERDYGGGKCSERWSISRRT